jgi:hypothetical protein
VPIDDQQLPLKPVSPTPRPTLAPSWVALLTAWLGLAVLIASVVFVCLPLSQHPLEELEHQRPYSFAERFLPFPIYGVALVLCIGWYAVIRQMRYEPRPLSQPLVNQRVQVYVGMALSLIGAAVIYVWVALKGPG